MDGIISDRKQLTANTITPMQLVEFSERGGNVITFLLSVT